MTKIMYYFQSGPTRFIRRIGNGLPWSSVLSRRNVRKPIRS